MCTAVADCDATLDANRSGAWKDGHEEWGRVIWTQPRGDGKSCEEVRANKASLYPTPPPAVSNVANASLVSQVSSALAAQIPGHEHLNCDDSKCYEKRTCRCSCTVTNGTHPVGSPTCAELEAPEADDSPDDLCQDLWGSCHLKESEGDCTQLRVQSSYNVNDGNCYRVGNETRSCNIQVRN